MSRNTGSYRCILAGVILSGTLFGCSNIPKSSTAFMNNEMSQLMDGLAGQDVSTVSERMGEPTAQAMDGDATLLIWDQFTYRESKEMYSSPWGMRPGRVKTARFLCSVRVLSVDEKIVAARAEGHGLACRTVYDRLTQPL